MIITPTPIITTHERSLSPAEEADKEAKERFDDEESREIFREGARFERGEDDAEWPLNFAQTLLAIWVLINLCTFIAGLIHGCDSRFYRDDHCTNNSKWTYVFPGYAAAAPIGEWMSK